ncbi:MAG: site-specific tyrosine recombinase/integron integrase [Promethearchaeota archaeon]
MSQHNNLSDFIEDFLIAKEIEEGCASSTIKAYKYDLKMFIKSVGDLNIDSLLLRQRIRFFLKKIKDRGYSKRGIARKIASLRSFFKFLTLNDYITKNPMSIIRTPKIKMEENLPKFLDYLEIKKIFSYLKSKGLRTYKDFLYYLIVRILYATMARVSELCNIKIKDIDFENNYVKLKGKGNKERIVPIDKITLKFINEYLKIRIFYDLDDYLIVNLNGNKLTPKVVQNYIQKIKAKCGFSENKIITPHIFRHTGATHLRRSGMDISELQDILGHSNPNTTRIYAKNDISKLRRSYNKMHPINNNSEL